MQGSRAMQWLGPLPFATALAAAALGCLGALVQTRSMTPSFGCCLPRRHGLARSR
jgi:uncharacterized membrane protein YjjB (DUF3815 family)